MYDSHLLGLVLRMILIDRREIDKKKSHTHKIGSFEPNQNGIWASKVEKYEMDREKKNIRHILITTFQFLVMPDYQLGDST